MKGDHFAAPMVDCVTRGAPRQLGQVLEKKGRFRHIQP